MFKRFFGSVKRKFSNFEFGKNSRRLAAIPTINLQINTLIRAYGANVLARSRYLCANDPHALAARDYFAGTLVGTGLKFSSLLKDREARQALHEEFDDWALQCDADGLTDFYGMQHRGATELFEAGEFFIRRRNRRPEDGLAVPLQLQLIPSEMLPLSHNVPATSNRNKIELGIEFDSIGRRVAYHFLRNHPGNDITEMYIGATDYVRVPAEDVIHVYRPLRIGQLRGIPHPLASLVVTALTGLYDDAEVERKRIAALFSVFVKRPNVESPDHPLGAMVPDSDSPGTSNYGLEPGAIIDLGYGEDISVADPADVGAQYEAFTYRQDCRKAAGMGIPYAAMTADVRNGNFASQRIAINDFRTRLLPIQSMTMAFQFCRGVWAWWVEAATLAGVAPWSLKEFKDARAKVTRVKVIRPRWAYVDPLKDVQAEKLEIDTGLSSRSDAIESRGEDPDEMDDRIAADKERAEERGLTFGAVPAQQSSRAGTEKPVSDVEEHKGDLPE